MEPISRRRSFLTEKKSAKLERRGLTMNEAEKLRVLIPHWIEHNQEHAEEYRRWAEKAGEASADIFKAAQALVQINAELEAALEKLGGALDHHHY
jgi:uncharacterized DUF497 family protein